MLVLPTSIANNISSWFLVPGSRFLVLHPTHLTGDETLHPIADAHQQRAAVVDAGGDAGLCTGRSLPRDPRAPAARRAITPGVEDSIEPAGEQIRIAPRQRYQRFGAQRGAIDRPTQLGFERRRPIAERGRIRGGAHVDPVADHEGRGGGGGASALREDTGELPARDDEIVR